MRTGLEAEFGHVDGRRAADGVVSANIRNVATVIAQQSASPGAPADQALHVVMPWLVRLRWVSVLALGAAAWAASEFWRVRVPVVPLAWMLGALAATNVVLAFQLRSPVPRRALIGALLIVDVGSLTGILYLLGGPISPFSIVYLVVVTVAAVSPGHPWAISRSASCPTSRTG
ncbi:MAG: hypothetical protein ABUS56_12800 [Acidobacteriota bacterium]